MKTSSSFSFRHRQRGSAFITVLLFTFVLLLLVASIAQWSLTERRANARNGYWLEARNAAEAVAEYGCYQVSQAFASKMNPTFTSTGTNPLSFPSSLATTYFANSNVDTSSLTLQAGNVTTVPSSGYYYVDPNDPNNTYDPMKSRYVQRRDVTIIGKATVNPPTGGGGPVTAYVEEKVSVRGAPLFAFAIFYSGNDLEFGETPKMDIYGPVHVNGNLFVGPAGSSPLALSLHGPVTASGNVFHAWRGTTTVAQEGGSGMSDTTPVYFSTDGVGSTSSTLVNMLTSKGVWNDSTMGADKGISGLSNLIALVDQNSTTLSLATAAAARNAAFSQYASQTWKGNLQTAAMGIQSYNPMGLSEVVAQDSSGNNVLATDATADDGSVVGTGSGYGHGYGPHSLIEPPLAAASSTDPYASAKASIEEQKFSEKAGLYIKVTVDSSNNAQITAYGDPRYATTLTTEVGPNGGSKLGTVPSNVITFIPYTKTTTTTTHTTTSHGHTTTTTTTTTNIDHGLYDQHQDVGVNLVQIDMAQLKTAVADMTTSGTPTTGTDFIAVDNTKWGSGATGGYDKYNPGSTGWNGGIYVDVSDASGNQTSVLLANGKVTSGSSLLPTQPNSVSGLTVATNAPAYILGSFNTDGSIASTSASNNSALYPDDYPTKTPANSVESPVCIAADAVTVLSPDYFGTGSGSGATNLAPSGSSTNGSSTNAGGSYTTSAPTATGDVEIAAALLTGSIITSPDSSGTQQYSGGVHNLPRFLENWSTHSNIVAIRGSMVSMYLSRTATAGWSQSYYSAPQRQWGYDQIFANGKFPPISPQVLSYRRVDFTYLKNTAEYNSEVSGL